MLKIAICLDSPGFVDAWELALIETLLDEPGYELVSAILMESVAAGPMAQIAQRLVLGIDRKLFGRLHRVSKPIKIAELFAQRTPAPTIRKGAQDDMAPFDILIDLRERFERELVSLNPTAEHWRFSFLGGVADNPFGFMQTGNLSPGAYSLSLQMSGPGRSPPREARAVCNTKASAIRNQEQAQQAAIGLVLRELRRRLHGLPDDQAPDPKTLETIPTTLPHRNEMEHLVQLACWGAERVGVAVADRLRILPPQFRTVIARGDPLSFLPKDGVPVADPEDGFLADPFLHANKGSLHLFCEVFDRRKKRGYIGVSRLDQTAWTPPIPALDTGTHASFPFIFDWRGETWMIPETVANNRVEVWRCRHYPDDWELHNTALDGAFPVDTAVFWANGKWWLFTALGQPPLIDHCTELYLYTVSGPDLDQLRPHPLNPVVSDARFARNAGRPFEQDGRLYRPSQSNRHGVYGYGLNIMEITALSETAYCERQVRFLPGLHHVDAHDGYTVFDVRRGTSDYPDRRGRAVSGT